MGTTAPHSTPFSLTFIISYLKRNKRNIGKKCLWRLGFLRSAYPEQSGTKRNMCS